MNEIYDLVIIGGGINGTALAALAAENGYRTALLEKTDFGSGVTSRSTRLIHGGLRYLEHGQIGVVRESLREREALLADFPHQVKPLPFLIPIYRNDSRGVWRVALGLAAYSALASSRRVEKHRQLSVAAVAEAEPGLKREDLDGGFVYFDCQATYPERLALEMALAAEQQGAEVRNHTPVVELMLDAGGRRVTGVRAESGDEFPARLVVNAAGPWVDEVRGFLPGGAEREHPLLTLVSGSHIITGQFPGAPHHAVYHEAVTDRRPFFVIPWRGLWLIGTTEKQYAGEPGSPEPSEDEVAYLLRETNGLFPEARLGPEAVLYAYAGARPLLHSESNQAQALSRGHTVYDHEEQEGLAGLLTMAGGKLTTARALAAQALERAALKLERPKPVRKPAPAWDDEGVPARLAAIYGRGAVSVAALAKGRPELARPVCMSAAAIGAEIVHAVKNEKAQTVGDVMLRRTGVAFEPCRGLDCAEPVARLMAPLLGWDEAGIAAAVTAYQQELERTLHRRAAC